MKSYLCPVPLSFHSHSHLWFSLFVSSLFSSKDITYECPLKERGREKSPNAHLLGKFAIFSLQGEKERGTDKKQSWVKTWPRINVADVRACGCGRPVQAWRWHFCLELANIMIICYLCFATLCLVNCLKGNKTGNDNQPTPMEKPSC